MDVSSLVIAMVFVLLGIMFSIFEFMMHREFLKNHDDNMFVTIQFFMELLAGGFFIGSIILGLTTFKSFDTVASINRFLMANRFVIAIIIAAFVLLRFVIAFLKALRADRLWRKNRGL